MNSSRRKFIKNAALMSGGIGLEASGLVSGCTPVKYITPTMSENKFVIKKSDWGESNFVVIKAKPLPRPVYLGKLPEGQYTALLMQCTHKQCEVRPFKQGLSCPCHGSEFDQTGKVLEGPAREDLMKFTVTEDEENIYIS